MIPSALKDAVLPAGSESGDASAPKDTATQATAAHQHDVLSTAEASRRLGIFVDFMRAAGLELVLRGEGPFTLLAPTERAFQKLSVRERDALLADSGRLSRVMRSHVIAGRVSLPKTDAPCPVTTIDGDTLVLTLADGNHRVGNVRIVQANIPASNGIIHAIDSILF